MMKWTQKMTKASRVRKFWGSLLFLLSLFFFLVSLWSDSVNEMAAMVIVFALPGILLLLWPTTKNARFKYEEKQRGRLTKALQEGIPLASKHLTGLSVAPNVQCTIRFWPNGITFDSSGMKFELPYGRIHNLQVATNWEVHQQYVSSAGGAVAGGDLFGPLGALVGGDTQLRSASVARYYFVVTYDKDSSPQYLSFEIDRPPKYKWYIEGVKQLLKQEQTRVSL